MLMHGSTSIRGILSKQRRLVMYVSRWQQMGSIHMA